MTWKYEGIEITVEQDGWFAFEGSERRFGQLAEAKAAVEAFLSRKASVEKARLAIPAIGSDGMEYTVTGVHAGNDSLLTRPPLSRDCREVYYAAQNAKKLVVEQIALMKRLKKVEKELADIRVGDYRNKYKGNPQDLADRWAELQKSEVEAVNQ